MKIHADFTQQAVVHSSDEPWINSPMKGVDRRPLDRIGDEVARATTIVRYAPGSHFSEHVHTGGEEFLVLDGVFQDEHGDYPAGTYVRNPPNTKHTPRSKEGCIIFVKLWQFEPEDNNQFSVDTIDADYSKDDTYPDVESLLLHKDEVEQVFIKKVPANSEYSISAEHGAEILMLEGELTSSGHALRPHSWQRVPVGQTLNMVTNQQGATFWLKIGNQQRISHQIKRVQNA